LKVIQPDGLTWYTESENYTGDPVPIYYSVYNKNLSSGAMRGTWTMQVSYRNIIYRHYFTVSCVSHYILSNETVSYGRIASDYIESTASASNSSKVMLQAANHIILKPGFEAKSGAVLKARIKSCNYAE
jgi:hypothetical protein